MSDDLVALARECGAHASNRDTNPGTVVVFLPNELATFAARLRAAPAAQGASCKGDPGECAFNGACMYACGAALSQPAGQPEPTVNRYCAVGMCVATDKEHAPSCGICEGDPQRCDVHDCGDAHATQAEQAQGVSDTEDDPTWQELEAFRRKHWAHWNSAENLLIAHLAQKLKCSPAPASPLKVPEPKGLTRAWIERLALQAGECPLQSRVLLVSNLLRTLERDAAWLAANPAGEGK